MKKSFILEIFRQQMLLQKVHNYNSLAVFELEERILLHLRKNSACTMIELPFWKSVSELDLDYHKLATTIRTKAQNPMIMTIVK